MKDNKEEDFDEERYEVAQFDELGRSLLEERLKRVFASGERSKYLCATSNIDNCMFKYFEQGGEDDQGIGFCGVLRSSSFRPGGLRLSFFAFSHCINHVPRHLQVSTLYIQFLC